MPDAGEDRLAMRLVGIGLWLISVFSQAESLHWSLRPVAEIEPAGVDRVEWNQNSIDRFVFAKLQSEAIPPGTVASPGILLRRLHYNLIGLPPTPSQVDEFLAAYHRDRSEAVARVVDQLLDSRHFGEKWARHWLDLARFAESNGKDRDVVFPDAWRYRDYVIDSFNSDKPINQFIREQIAGDLLPGATDEQIVATAFLALGPKAFQEVNLEKFAMDVVDEQIDVLSRSILGLTVACARCHDHKFDPIPTKDYYALAGILLSSETRYGPGPLYFGNHHKDTERVPIGENIDDRHAKVLQWRTEILTTTEKVTGLRSAAYRIQRDIAGSLRERGLKKAKQAPDLAEKEKKMLSMRAEADELNQKRLDMVASPPGQMPGYTMAMQKSIDQPPKDCAIREGGIHNHHGDVVARGSFTIPGMPDFGLVSKQDSGRLQLADWLSSDFNPLTARVFVNRVWHHLYGAGLVRSVDNFGLTGEQPSHPELLDLLAHDFVEDNWNLKRLVRRIVLSRSWQLSSLDNQTGASIDPENRWLWRANFRRLDIEALRDSVLFISGQLELEPRQGSLFQDVYAGKDYGEPNAHRVNFDRQIVEDVHRTVYLPFARNSIPEFLPLFDFADPTSTTGARNSRTIPAQALFLINSPLMENQSRAAAKRILSLPGNQRIEYAWRMVTAGKPAPETVNLMRDQIGKSTDELEAWTDLMQMLFASVPFRYLE